MPLTLTVKFAAIGLGLLKDERAVATMSRSGDCRELLRGPLLYGIVFVAATVLAFRELVAAVALISLCFGDAAAEIVGRRYGSTAKLPWSPRKSYAGSAGFVLVSSAAMIAFAVLFVQWGFATDVPLQPILLASAVGALVESLPMLEVDNILVPAAVAAAFRLSTRRGWSAGLKNRMEPAL